MKFENVEEANDRSDQLALQIWLETGGEYAGKFNDPEKYNKVRINSCWNLNFSLMF